MGITETPTPQHWNYFLALEDDVVRMSRYLEPTKANFDAYSLELARILFAAASEIDVVSKCLCVKLDPESRADNINKYRNEILASRQEIVTSIAEIPRFGLTLTPWEPWGSEENPLWWKAYNNVKHRRDTHFKEASLKNTLNAVAGLFVLLLYFYDDEAQRGELSPDPRLFRAGHPFVTDRLAWGTRAIVYQLAKGEPVAKATTA